MFEMSEISASPYKISKSDHSKGLLWPEMHDLACSAKVLSKSPVKSHKMKRDECKIEVEPI